MSYKSYDTPLINLTIRSTKEMLDGIDKLISEDSVDLETINVKLKNIEIRINHLKILVNENVPLMRVHARGDFGN